MLPSRSLLITALALLGAAPAAAQRPSRTEALATVERAIARMGGDSLLGAIGSIRLDVLTQWNRTTFATHPFADQPSYEHNVELRDYARGAWRNTRGFLPALPGREVVDVVADTIGARLMPTAPGGAPRWIPLNVAYIEERRELFAFAPERVLLHARADTALRALADTVIDGAAHARVQATIDGWPTTILIRRSDDLPAMVRFRADETNDFGLAPWGEMEVEFWFTGWQASANGLLLPRQRDVRRVGRPYKRMTVLRTEINPPVPADSFAISPEVAAEYLATQRRPMWDVSLDDATLVEEHFLPVPPFTGAAGAVRLGGKWLLVEPGVAEGVPPKVAARLAALAPGTPIGAAVATIPATGNGGVRWVVEGGLPMLLAPGFTPWARQMLGSLRGTTVVTAPRWVRIGTDSLWVEPVDLPDAAGTLALYAPTLRWLYLPMAGVPIAAPIQRDLVARLAARGLVVERIGSSRQLVAPLPSSPAAGMPGTGGAQ